MFRNRISGEFVEIARFLLPSHHFLDVYDKGMIVRAFFISSFDRRYFGLERCGLFVPMRRGHWIVSNKRDALRHAESKKGKNVRVFCWSLSGFGRLEANKCIIRFLFGQYEAKSGGTARGLDIN